MIRRFFEADVLSPARARPAAPRAFAVRSTFIAARASAARPTFTTARCFAVLATLAALLALAGCDRLSSFAERAPWAAAEERPLWGSGTIEGTSLLVSAEVRGTVGEIRVTEGEHYEEGAALLSLDAPELDIEQGMRALDRDIASVQRRLLDVGARAEDIREAQARVRRAERDLRQATDDYERMARLLEGGSITRSRYEASEVALARAEAEYESATQSLERLENLTRPEEYEIASLREDQAALAVERAALNVSRRELHLPRTAWIDTLLVETGELVQPGQPVARLVNRAPVTLTVYIAQGDLGNVTVGDRADVLVDAWPEERFEGTVRRISEEAEFTPGNVQTRDDRARLVFAVDVEIANEDHRLRPGMGAEAEFPDAGGSAHAPRSRHSVSGAAGEKPAAAGSSAGGPHG